MLRTLITRPRIVFAGLLAIGAASLAFIATERRGDPQAVIVETERQISTIDTILKRHTYELKDAGSPKPADKSRALYRLSGPKGELLFVEGPADPNTSEVERIVADFYQKGNKQYVSHDSAWNEIQTIWAGLTWGNQQIAEAKALRQFDSKPSSASSYDWDYRFRKSKDQLQVQEVAAFQSQRALYTAAAAVGTFAAVILVLAVCGWLWRATLARIRELANAMRGK